MAAEFTVEITADGRLKIETGNLSGPHHGSADELVDMINKLAGGVPDVKNKRKGLKHSHAHGSHQHTHSDGTTHSH